MSENTVTVSQKTSWLGWVGFAIWVVGALLLVQNAVASYAEMEPRAATMLWISLAVWLVAGVVIWFVRRKR